ncbi:hypothetical protein BpHYR1_028263 [Brachionus plicatilis]|uniref:Uncharacterized protein n=1 Tax=Brachionus plicatilis TaxID=10195 RepID=A0A3M7R0Z2_BRAPC|nr:hypothetical protein BpHYR1_028263 [Brachionus plicatilis]
MSDTESSSTSILVTQRNEEDTENDTAIEEIPVKKARKASRVYNHHADFETYNQALDMIKNKFEGYSWAAKEKQTIVQPTTSSNLAPSKRGRPRKNP